MNPYRESDSWDAQTDTDAGLRCFPVLVRDPKVEKALRRICYTHPATPQVLVQALFNLAIDRFLQLEEGPALARAIRSERGRQAYAKRRKHPQEAGR